MDLGPIEERANEFATWVGKFDSAHRIPAAFASAADVPALIAEVKRLRAEVRLAKASAHSASLALGAQLAARPAPTWDEEVVVEAVARALSDDWNPDRDPVLTAMFRDYAHTALTAALPHLTAAPSATREEVARTWIEAAPESGPGAWERASERVRERSLPRADALLARFTMTPKEDR